jgi:3-deoxy-manno-octulosonate cytidylyltransferase (CMP-KDO synthetase)
MKAVILIPARLDSSRLDRKMLADLEGEPLIVRTWRQALKSRLAEKVVVATDSREIAAVLDA